ncbi:uncharacterized protein LOC130803319 isoform X3 [Amaranthus tricolor]|uniref:uncharacterized protein LOC130803319 isoform X3 n=1 Tax=Amaranthus tricolor TaxID=29722 RepID=UPI00258BD27C|nr:uncharacterized protein LOC130803319 isoform X3 [Amaranthus tricolor]
MILGRKTEKTPSQTTIYASQRRTRTKSMASTAAAPESHNPKLPKGHPSGPAAPLTSSSVPIAPLPLKTSLQGVNTGKLRSRTISGGSAHVQSQTPYCKGFSKNQVPLKSSNSGWRASGTNDNLVIKFSDDDDSGSDDEERSRENPLVFGRPPLALNTNRRPPVLPHVKMQTVSQATKNERKVIPRKVSSSRTFNLSATKTLEHSVRSGASALVDQRSRFKNSSAAVRTLENTDAGCSKNLSMSTSKLEDLRQKIAARENELKLKQVQHNMENVAEPCRDPNLMGLRKVFSSKCKSVPVDVQTLPKEPDRKRLKKNASGVAVSCSLSDWISLPKNAALLMNTTPTDPLERSMSKHPGVISEIHPSRSAPNQDIHESNMSKMHYDATPVLKSAKFSSDSGLQAHCLQVSNSKLGSPDVSPDNTSLLLPLGGSTTMTGSELDLQSHFELEELLNKELEEAQEHRQKCEVEERNALIAYRRAQRALLEANARCTYLYRKRELSAVQLRSVLMEDSNFLYSSRKHHETEEKWNFTNKFPEFYLDLIPSNHQWGEFQAGNQLGSDSNVPSADDDAHRSSAHEDGHNFGSEACSEPDASTSELVRESNFAANGIRSPSVDPVFSPDDDYVIFPLDHKSLNANVSCPRSKKTTKESEKDMDVDSATNFSKDVSQDLFSLEEYLRSKLISRLSGSSLKCNGIGHNNESSVERALDEGVTNAKNQLVVPSVSLSDPNVSATECKDGLNMVEVSISNLLNEADVSISNPPFNSQNRQVEEHFLNDSSTPSFYPGECGLFSDIASTSSISSSAVFKSVMKAIGPFMLDRMQINDNILSRHNQDKLCSKMTTSTEHLVLCADYVRIDSYTCKSVIDPLWPLCMYELRGRCNNDECPWQHTKDYSESDDCQSGLPSDHRNLKGQTGISSALTPPRYLVCLDSLKDESHSFGSLSACYFGSFGKSVPSRSLAVSSSLLKHIPSDEPCLDGNGGYVESYSGSGHSLYYYQSRNTTGNVLRNGLAGNDLSLELALVILCQEAIKIEGMKKALVVLSRALEADPSSFPMWIIYLILFYSTKYSAGDLNKENSVQEDLFSHAVKHSEVSYELWLLYINSRCQLDEHLAAYERALSRLCNYGFANDGQWIHRSTSILDLSLQMLYCFCVSGNSAKAFQRIRRLVYADGDSDESHSLLLSDILQCLTISDKCVFWVCCVYLVIYRKLPDSLVQQLEFEKDISSIEWPSVDLQVDEKQLVSKLMEKAIDSVGLLTDNISLESSTLNSVHLFAVNHIKLSAAVDGVESCKIVLKKYQNLYSSCLDLIILSARAHDFIGESTSLEKFEETVNKWPKNVSGSQCIWNQYAEQALKKGRPDKAKKIMDHWFQVSGLSLFFHNHSVDGDTKRLLADSLSGLNLSNHISHCSNVDLVFGLLNLSLYKLFHNDVLEAHSAIDKALKVADTEVLRHCIMEHASFLFNNGSHLMKDVSVRGIIDILKGYILHAWAILDVEPLTRKFIQDIKKPRTRQLVRNILRPITPDSFLVNLVLEIWFGSSLLPPKFEQLKDMVDFVEAMLEVSPGNYHLVISVCKLICGDSSYVGSSKFASVLYWASSLLVNTIDQAFPIPPEYVWLEAADLLVKLTNVQEIRESFHQRALSAHPFSINLWKSFLNCSTNASKRKSVVEAAKEKGLELD